MSNELVAAERWLFSTLTGDATLTGIVGSRVYGHVVPPTAARPYVFYTKAAAADDYLTMEANRIWANFVYAVRIVNKTESYVSLEAGADAIEAALHRESGSNVSGVIVACVRQAPFDLIEIDQDGSQLRGLGGLYRLFVQ